MHTYIYINAFSIQTEVFSIYLGESCGEEAVPEPVGSCPETPVAPLIGQEVVGSTVLQKFFATPWEK